MTNRSPPPLILRWLAHLPLAALPMLAAGVLEGPRLGQSIVTAASDRLAEAGQGWASVTVEGRDAEIRGTAPGPQALDAALAAVAATPGVRRVVAHVLVAGT